MTDNWRRVEGTTLPTKMRITDGGKLQLHEVQYSDKIIVDHVAAMEREIREHGRRKDSAMGHYVGSVPLVLYNRWIKEDPDIQHDGAKLAAKLRTAEFSKLMVRQ